MATGTLAALVVHLLKQPRVNLREALEDRISVEQALEAQVKALQTRVAELTVLAEDSRRDTFNTSVLCEKLKEENKRLGVKILEQQEEIDQLRRVVAAHEAVAEARRHEDDERRERRSS